MRSREISIINEVNISPNLPSGGYINAKDFTLIYFNYSIFCRIPLAPGIPDILPTNLLCHAATTSLQNKCSKASLGSLVRISKAQGQMAQKPVSLTLG